MRKIYLFLIFLLMFAVLCADEFMQPLNNKIPLYTQPTAPQECQGSRDRPAWSFITTPTGLISSYYDYMPGSYNSFPLRVQPDEQGMYVVFHGRETAASTRRVYFTYIDASGTVLTVATIGTTDIHQGYAGIGIDPVTADPMVSWHENYPGGPIAWKCVFTYDLFHLGSPGLWKAPFTLIDETISTPYADDVFIWPYIWIGPSPEPDKRRVYIVARNQLSHQGSGNPSENELIGYADFDVSDLNALLELDWTWQTIPELDGWNQGTPEEIRPNQAFTISDDGQVVFIGYSSTDGATTTIGDQLYVFYNDNYGEGGFEHIAVSAEWDIDNPQNQDGTYRFVDLETGAPHELYMEPYFCNHANGIFTHDNTKIQWLGNMNMMIRPSSWYPDLLLMYLKLYTYDIATQEFTFQDFVDLPGVNPTDNTPVLPWDIDEDGFVDNFDPDGYVEWVPGHPIYHDASDKMFHENTNKLTKNDDKSWLAAVWMDGVKNRYAVQGIGYPGWETYAELKIALSNDNGENWSEPITMNAKADDENYVLEFDGMKPCYFYPSDKIIDLGDDHGKLDIFFYNDNSFGSYSIDPPSGSNDGGTLTYMSLDLDFSYSHTQPNIVMPVPVRLHQNYPNPFNPETIIAYSLNNPANVTLEIYNLKGQKVRTLINAYQQAGNHNLVWDAKDSNNHEVSSGVYFYKLVSEGNFGDYTSSKKMIFLK